MEIIPSTCKPERNTLFQPQAKMEICIIPFTVFIFYQYMFIVYHEYISWNWYVYITYFNYFCIHFSTPLPFPYLSWSSILQKLYFAVWLAVCTLIYKLSFLHDSGYKLNWARIEWSFPIRASLTLSIVFDSVLIHLMWPESWKELSSRTKIRLYLFFHFAVCTFGFYIRETILYLNCIWIVWPNIMISECIHFPTDASHLTFFMAE